MDAVPLLAPARAPPDVVEAVRGSFSDRRKASAKVRDMALTVETVRMSEHLDAAARERHGRKRAVERVCEEVRRRVSEALRLQEEAQNGNEAGSAPLQVGDNHVVQDVLAP